MMAIDPARRIDDFATVFGRVFPRLSELHASFRQDGLLAVAVWNNHLLAHYIHVPLENEPQFAILGRHDRCDLSLANDSGISLRHALLGARRHGNELRVRLLDLQSGAGLHTEDGRACEAITADGAMFARIGSYHLFLLPTGSLAPLSWATTAEGTWEMIPERVYRDCRLPSRGAPAPLLREAIPTPLNSEAAGRRPQSIITQIIDPPGLLRPFRPGPGARGPRVAKVELGNDAGYERFVVHEAELARGLLIGRYDRCQIGAQDQAMSRVHLLLIRDGEEVWVVDTASSNGTTMAGEPLRRVKMRDGVALILARTVCLRWLAAPGTGTDEGPALPTATSPPTPGAGDG
jgi:hypothetical protein